MSATDYAVPPGEYIAEWLDENEMSQAELARRLGYSPKHVSLLVRGAHLSAEAAGRLELVTGVAAYRWLQLETLYRQDLDRLAVKLDAPKVKELLAALPVPELRKRGYLKHDRRKPGHCVYDLMAFFRVGSLDALFDRVSTAPLAAFRQGVGPKRGAVMSWLQIGEMEADGIEIQRNYRPENLSLLVPSLRSLTTATPEHFGETLVSRLAEVGVRLIYVKDFPGTKTYGATRWYRGHPLIQLSLRRRTDDTFWFTFFHEVGHAIHHLPGRHNQMFVDTDDEKDQWETDADQFAGRTLIPQEVEHELVQLQTLQDVTDFAAKIGVAPGVVVGRLQHDREWSWDRGNGLRRSLMIVDDEEGEE